MSRQDDGRARSGEFLPDRNNDGGAPGAGRRPLGLAIAAGTAAWGFALALSIAPLMIGAASADQAPGHLASIGVGAADVLRAFALLALLPLAAAFAARLLRIAAALAGAPREWTLWFLASLLSGFWLAGLRAPLWSVAVLPLAGAALALLLRRQRAGWGSEDVALLPSALVLYYGIAAGFPSLGVGPGAFLSALAVAVLRVVVAAALPDPRIGARAFAFTPAAFLLQSTFAPDPVRRSAWVGILGALAVPLVVAAGFRLRPGAAGTARRIAVLLAFPLAIFAFPSTRGWGYAERLPRVDFFENGHSLMPASEMMRGELPWRDVVPGHGLIEDGLLDLAALRVSDDTTGRALHWRWRFASINGIALYALTIAATRSPDAALAAFMLGSTLFPTGVPFGRTVVSIAALALAVGAVTSRRARLFVPAGLLLVLAGLHALDFAAYAGVGIMVAAALFGTGWKGVRSAAAHLAIGITAGAGLLGAALLALGIVEEFVRTTFVEILSLGPAYTLGFPAATTLFGDAITFPEVVTALVRRTSFPYVAWVAVLVATAAILGSSRRPLRQRALAIVGVWIVAAGLSSIERHHLYFAIAVPTFLVAALVAMWKRGRGGRVAVAAAASVLIVVAQPTAQLIGYTIVRAAPEAPPEGWAEYRGLKRARGAYFQKEHVEAVDRLRAFIDANLAPHETFFDFANVPILFYLLDRPSPVRQYEVPFFQAEPLQREVIARLEADRRVRFVLLRFPGAPPGGIDGIANEVRAPLVAEFIRSRFPNVLEEGGIAIAVRGTPR